MKNLNSIASERVCDLTDGHADGVDGAQALNAVLSDPQALRTWHAYHVIGDVLRSPELAPGGDDFAFLAKLELRLAQEPVRPQQVDAATPAQVQVIAPATVVDTGRQVANAAVFRWKMLAGAACMAFVGVLGANLWTQTTTGQAAQLAARAPAPVDTGVPTVVAAQSDAGTMIRDTRLDDLMAAHRQLGGHSALQVPAEFLRNATYEGPNR